MDERLRIVALNAGLENLLAQHSELIESTSKRARVYAQRLPPLNMDDEPAHVYRPSTKREPE